LFGARWINLVAFVDHGWLTSMNAALRIAALLAALSPPLAIAASQPDVGSPPTDTATGPDGDTQCHRAPDPDVMAAISGSPALALAETGGEGGPGLAGKLPAAVPFDQGSDSLPVASMQVLDDLAPALKRALDAEPKLVIEVVGRSRDRLSPALAATRARMVRAYLMGRGISSVRLRLAATNDPAGGVELRVAR
jgi:outer membrane protein OmpA-like peptidoglycan-associated protein